MAKIQAGRLAGIDGMTEYTAEELRRWADQMQFEPGTDDPVWALRWAGKMRKVARAKEKNHEHKQRQHDKLRRQKDRQSRRSESEVED